MKDFLLSLPRYQKIAFLMISDFIIGFFVWVIFGSPVASYLTSNFSINLLEIIYSQLETFFYPIILSLLILYFLGFYKSLTRFKSTDEGFIKAFIGAGVFGITYILIFLSQQDVVEKNYIFIFTIQGFLLGSIFLSGILFVRESAKLLLGHASKNDDAIPLVIYGAGAIGGELLKTLSMDQSKRVIAFYDDESDLHGSTKFGVPIVSKEKSLKRFKKIYPNLQI